MKVYKNELKNVVFEKDNFIYLISYKTPIAKICNVIETDKSKPNNYGIFLTKDWNYSRTTLKHLYDYLELHATQRDKTGNTIPYMLGQKKNKKEYIKQLINDEIIKIIEKEEI